MALASPPPTGLPNMHVARMTAESLLALATEAPRSTDGNETGGILLGHDTAQGLVVTVAGDPGPNAERAPDRFRRDLKHAQRLADEAYDRDGSVWIGEWHTHPTGPAVPSGVDLETYLSHLSREDLGFDRFLALIALRCPDRGWDHVHLTAWVVHGSVAEQAELKVEEQDA